MEWISRGLRIEGEDKEGVWGGTEFLQKVALGQKTDMTGKRVAVVGGGNTAIDAARTAMRLGAAEVNLLYRRTREEMPAQEVEVREAEEEGLKCYFLVNPTKVVGGDKVEGIELTMQDLGDFDESARRRPQPIVNSEYVLPVDVIITAIGQSTDVSCAQGCGVDFNRNTTIKVGKDLSSARPGVFAAGDAVLGPATVIEAVAQGNRVAQEVDRYLQAEGATQSTQWLAYDSVPLTYSMEDYALAARPEMPVQEPVLRRHNWHEVELGFDEETCRAECKRCLRCDIEEK